MATPVTDPKLLAQLDSGGGGAKPVTDPDLLEKLNGGEKRSTAADVGIEGGKGLLRGAIGFAGDVADEFMQPFRDIAAATKYAAGKPNEQPATPGYGAQMKAQIKKAGADIEPAPQTPAGKFASPTGEVLGNPVTYAGPGGFGAKVATGVTSALGGEAAREGAEALGVGPMGQTGAQVLGAVAGGKAPTGAARVVTPIPATPERIAAAQTLANEGITGATAGQRTGSKSLQYAESHLGDAPGAGGKASASQEQIGSQFTSAVLKRAGIKADRATPDVIDGAFKRIGGDMDDIAARNAGKVDTQFFNDIHTAQDEYNATVQQGNRRAVVDDTVNDFSNRLVNTPVLTGDQYQKFRSRLTRLQRGAFNDPEYSQVLGDYVEALDNMMERSISNPADLQAWQDARRQYRNLIPISRAAAGAGETAAEGIITPVKMRSIIAGTQRGQREYSRGQGDFAELTRAGNILLAPLPNSGTAQRELMRFITSSAGAAIGGATTGGVGAGVGAAAGAAMPGVAGRALMSPLGQAYLGNQVAPNLPEMLPSPALRSALTSPLSEGSGPP
jgi:hypothetical protein